MDLCGNGPALDSVKLDTVSLPIAIGLVWMMYPVVAKVKYGKNAAGGGQPEDVRHEGVKKTVVGYRPPKTFTVQSISVTTPDLWTVR